MIKMKQIIYTRCAPRKDLFNKNLSVYDAGFGVFSLSEDVYDLDADTLKSLQTLLERRNGSDFLTNNFCSFEYTEINGNYFYIHEAPRKYNKSFDEVISNNRPGNYIKQCFIGMLSGFPVEYIDSPQFDAQNRVETYYYKNIDNGTVSVDYLPNVDDKVFQKGLLNIQKQQMFINTLGKDVFVKLLYRIFAGGGDSIVCIADTTENAKYLIYEIQKSFLEKNIYRKLTFSTNVSETSFTRSKLFYVNNKGAKVPFFKIIFIDPSNKLLIRKIKDNDEKLNINFINLSDENPSFDCKIPKKFYDFLSKLSSNDDKFSNYIVGRNITTNNDLYDEYLNYNFITETGLSEQSTYEEYKKYIAYCFKNLRLDTDKELFDECSNKIFEQFYKYYDDDISNKYTVFNDLLREFGDSFDSYCNDLPSDKRKKYYNFLLSYISDNLKTIDTNKTLQYMLRITKDDFDYSTCNDKLQKIIKHLDDCKCLTEDNLQEIALGNECIYKCFLRNKKESLGNKFFKYIDDIHNKTDNNELKKVVEEDDDYRKFQIKRERMEKYKQYVKKKKGIPQKSAQKKCKKTTAILTVCCALIIVVLCLILVTVRSLFFHVFPPTTISSDYVTKEYGSEAEKKAVKTMAVLKSDRMN